MKKDKTMADAPFSWWEIKDQEIPTCNWSCVPRSEHEEACLEAPYGERNHQ